VARWDTIGTLTALGVEIVTLFAPVVRRVMGRKAPRNRIVNLRIALRFSLISLGFPVIAFEA
jgi:hypothetical protein